MKNVSGLLLSQLRTAIVYFRVGYKNDHLSKHRATFCNNQNSHCALLWEISEFLIECAISRMQPELALSWCGTTRSHSWFYFTDVLFEFHKTFLNSDLLIEPLFNLRWVDCSHSGISYLVLFLLLLSYCSPRTNNPECRVSNPSCLLLTCSVDASLFLLLVLNLCSYFS